MKVKIHFAVVLLIFSIDLEAQHLAYAKSVMDTLCSPYFAGRAYADSGHIKAADFIYDQCRQYAEELAVQKFALSSNSLIGQNLLIKGTDTLHPGRDYHCAAFSPSVSGTFPVRLLDKNITDDSLRFREFLGEDHREHIVALDTTGFRIEHKEDFYLYITLLNGLKSSGVVALSDKLPPFVPAAEPRDHFLFYLKKNRYKHITEDSLKVIINSRYNPQVLTRNIMAKLPGRSDSALVFTAHYDHLGTMGGETYFPGANDNASGVSAVLALLKYFSAEELPYSLYFIFFSGEESGILGARHFVNNPLVPLDKIKFLINLDMAGSGSEGIQVVNGSVHRDFFDKLTEINNRKNFLTNIKIRGAAANSDHYPFHERGVKSFFIYTLGEYKHYHNIHDRADALPLTAFDDLLNLLIVFTKTFE